MVKSFPCQVRLLREKLVMPENEVRVNVDGVTARAMMTYIIRRHDNSVRRVLCLSWYTVSGPSFPCILDINTIYIYIYILSFI